MNLTNFEFNDTSVMTIRSLYNITLDIDDEISILGDDYVVKNSTREVNGNYTYELAVKECLTCKLGDTFISKEAQS
jgi:hypothetical protein